MHEDHCTQEGAAKLATRLRNHWLQHGYRVTTTIERFDIARSQTPDAEHRPVFLVRSDLDNGLPQNWLGRKIIASSAAVSA